MRIVYMGTSDFAVYPLRMLLDSGYDVKGVVTQPDKPRGRGKKLAFSPVKEVAVMHNLSLFQPARIKSPEAVEFVKSWQPDLIVVVAYGQILSRELLSLPPLGCINIHASLLPFYRGPAPIQRALMNGEKETGVTIMYMDEGLDTGDIIKQWKMPVDEDINYGELKDVLTKKGAELLIETIKDMEKGKVERYKQDHSQATYAPMLTPDDEIIMWDKSAGEIHNKIRALSPVPGAYSYIEGFKLKIFRSRVVEKTGYGVPGEIKGISREGFLVQTGEGILEILEVQREGKKRMSSLDFLRGSRIGQGIILGEKK
ncbi:methionyl-tRNA formyltransferase [Thermosyntropha lipolytica DSM 11003]|uniref:Methionyl-tRNA formyltransferase n=1 Tax=Thermosyntropha lipolytica DSM 11003 TaxID=1123382 RepID=A0A1M5RQR8_9FIRM|nr:methionyl-tRNA formyltransferase [Thermosyntropha lipolytica]SHH28554.1 methionyl-tRNA formyltransferase [Thermosyntropha lipolytica DSM 11003]